MSRYTGPVTVVAVERSQISAHTSATAAARCTRVARLISWKVRCTVESDGTLPNSSCPPGRCSMSAQLSPPPASRRAT